MATVDGDLAGRTDYGDGLLSGAVGSSHALPQGSGVFEVRYKMRAWETSVGWVTWISYGTPDPNPPAGTGPVEDVTIVASWE
jgi:hypothetical protein